MKALLCLYTQQIFIWKTHVWSHLINELVLCFELKAVSIHSLKR